MKILIATGIFPPEVGGPATLSAELAKRFVQAGHAVTVVTYANKQDNPHDHYSFPVIKIFRSQKKLFNYFNYFRTITRYARKADVIYSLDWFSGGVPLMIACFFLNKKYIVRVGGGYIWEKYLAEGKPPVTLKAFYEQGLYKDYKLMYFLIGQVLRRAAGVVFNSDDQRILYQTFYNLKPEKTVTIYNALPQFKFAHLITNYKKGHGARDKEIVFAGRFIKMKNVESLVKAFAKLTDPTFTLLLIGSGPTETEIHTLVKEYQLEDRVQFLPSMSPSDLYKRIANAYLVVIPSWTDISPHQAYECLSLGIPFLLTKENYLSISKPLSFVMIDPASVDDIAATLNRLLDKDEYEDFVDSLQEINFRQSWDDVLVQHQKAFKQFI